MSTVVPFPAPPSLLERMKASFSNLGVIAANYLPRGFKDCMIDMASQADKQAAEIAAVKEQLALLQMVIATNSNH